MSLNLGADFVMIHKLTAVGSRHAKIHGVDETGVVFQVAAQDLLRQFV